MRCPEQACWHPFPPVDDDPRGSRLNLKGAARNSQATAASDAGGGRKKDVDARIKSAQDDYKLFTGVKPMERWLRIWRCCIFDGVPKRSLIVALIVGTIPNLINRGDVLFGGGRLNLRSWS